MKTIKELNDTINELVVERKRNGWAQSWMYVNEEMYYYFLISKDDDTRFSYEDVGNFEVEISEQHSGNYRIDIKDRYKVHNFWIFDTSDFPIVANYVKDMIEHQYNSLIEKFKMIDLTSDAYYDKKPVMLVREYRDMKINEILS